MISSFRHKLLLMAILSISLSSGMFDTARIAQASTQTLQTTFTTNVLEPIDSQQQTILSIENLDNIKINSISVDASAIGGSSSLSVSPELMRISLAVNDTTPPGSYSLPITIVSEDQQVWKTEASIEVLPSDEKDESIDWDEEIIYFMLTDRFYDGNPLNNNPFNLPYDSADNPRGTYQGGDFAGISEKLSYLSDLGISTIWISPIVLNIAYDVSHGTTDGAFYGYHGYWAQSFTELNPHFGTLEEFHQLIDAASEQDIGIMVDVVLNHTGYGLHPSDGNSAEQISGYPTDSNRELFADMIRQTPGHDQQTESLSGLPDLMTELPEVRQQIVDWQTAWLELSTTEQGNSIKSYRVDTVVHVDPTTLQHFRNELTALDPAFKLLGEAWGAEPLNHKGFLNSGMMDSVLDFKFKETARKFINGNLEGANQDLVRRNLVMSSTATAGQFLSSHDETGFLYMLNGDLGKYKVAVTLQLTAKGQPVIYYGEELGQTGANNWPLYDNRYDFDWDSAENNPVLAHYQRIINFRQQHSEIFARGERHTVAGSNEDKWLLIERRHEGDSVYIAFNLSEEAQSITIPVTEETTFAIDEYSDQEYGVKQNAAGKPVIEMTIPSKNDGGTLLLHLSEGSFIPEE